MGKVPSDDAIETIASTGEELEKNDLIREDKFAWSRGDGEAAEEE